MLSVTDPGRRSSAVAPDRKPYARIPEVLPIPNLIELQLNSFNWFIENGLRELFDEISPIQDFTGRVMELRFKDYEFEAPKYSELECRTRDLTFSKPLYVWLSCCFKETGEIQRQRVYMGDFPFMTEQGTFIINGAERVVVSQLVRSPGVYYTAIEDPATGRDLFNAKVIPNRGAWLEFETAPRAAVRQGRPQAQARGHQAAARRRLRVQRRDARDLLQDRHGRAPVHHRDPGQGPHHHAR